MIRQSQLVQFNEDTDKHDRMRNVVHHLVFVQSERRNGFWQYYVRILRGNSERDLMYRKVGVKSGFNMCTGTKRLMRCEKNRGHQTTG